MSSVPVRSPSTMTRAARLAGRGRRSTSTSTRAPKRRSTPSSAVRVGFRPTSSMSTREPGSAAAATSQKAADEKSPGTDSCWPVQPLAAGHRHGQAVDVGVSAERRQRALGVIARRGRLDDAGRALGVEAGEQDRALDLRARRLGLDAQSRAAARRGWSAADGRRSASMRGAHPLERLDHPAHRPARQRRVADHRGGERMAGQHARQQPHRRAGVAGVERAPPANGVARNLVPVE